MRRGDTDGSERRAAAVGAGQPRRGGFDRHRLGAFDLDRRVLGRRERGDADDLRRACGVAGVRVERGEDLGPALDAAFASSKPTLIEVMTDPDGKPPLTMYASYPEPF